MTKIYEISTAAAAAPVDRSRRAIDEEGVSKSNYLLLLSCVTLLYCLEKRISGSKLARELVCEYNLDFLELAFTALKRVFLSLNVGGSY